MKLPEDRAERGRHFERLACRHLKKNGLRLITENYRCRWGEIDLIMRDTSSLIFVEVRFRGAGSFLSGALSVDRNKQQKLCRTALHYLSSAANGNIPTRFDVVSIAQSRHGKPEIDWIKNAFECG